MTRRFAEGTDVPVSRTRDAIEKLLRDFGARETQFVSSADRAAVGFVLQNGTMIRVVIPLALPAVPGPPRRSPAQAAAAAAAEERRRWRALLLVLRAKVEAIGSGISTLEREFLADVVITPDGHGTVGERLIPELQVIVRQGIPPGGWLLVSPPDRPSP